MTDGEQSALRAMVECVKMAKDKGATCYLYKRDGKGFWNLSHTFWETWLFKAYPGGRKILSAKGKKYFQDNDLQGVITYLETTP